MNPSSPPKLSEAESLQLISEMIRKARNSYLDTGAGPLLWGGVITCCSLVTYTQIRFGYRLPFDIWWLTLLALVPQAIFVLREKKNAQVRSHEENLMDAVWSAFGISLLLLLFINAGISRQLDEQFRQYPGFPGGGAAHPYMAFSTAHLMLLYGIPTVITGLSRRFRPMLIGGIICWMAACCSVFTGLAGDMLLTAVSAMAAWLIPGVILRIRYLKNRTAHVSRT